VPSCDLCQALDRGCSPQRQPHPHPQGTNRQLRTNDWFSPPPSSLISPYTFIFHILLIRGLLLGTQSSTLLSQNRMIRIYRVAFERGNGWLRRLEARISIQFEHPISRLYPILYLRGFDLSFNPSDSKEA